VTTKAEAFAAPVVFYSNENYLAGKNDLSLEEKILIDAFERHDRADLAYCVRGGRIYSRLGDAIGNERKVSTTLNGLCDAFLGETTLRPRR